MTAVFAVIWWGKTTVSPQTVFEETIDQNLNLTSVQSIWRNQALAANNSSLLSPAADRLIVTRHFSFDGGLALGLKDYEEASFERSPDSFNDLRQVINLPPLETIRFGTERLEFLGHYNQGELTDRFFYERDFIDSSPAIDNLAELFGAAGRTHTANNIWQSWPSDYADSLPAGYLGSQLFAGPFFFADLSRSVRSEIGPSLAQNCYQYSPQKVGRLEINGQDVYEYEVTLRFLEPSCDQFIKAYYKALGYGQIQSFLDLYESRPELAPDIQLVANERYKVRLAIRARKIVSYEALDSDFKAQIISQGLRGLSVQPQSSQPKTLDPEVVTQ